VIDRLIEDGKAYYCFCSIEKVEALKAGQLSEGKLLKYDGTCRDKKPSLEDLKKPYVVRFKLPYTKGPISFDDLVYGQISFDAEQLEDFIIVRSDGTPTYNLVVVIDDAAMKISHVIRGEDHISNTPKQILLYQACGYTTPQFAHIPLILGPSGDRLSKRDGAVSALEYRKQGYLPEALFNYLVRLGWAHGNQEVFTKNELIEAFTLGAVGKKGAIFDLQKLNWLNSLYIRAASDSFLLNQIVSYLEPNFTTILHPFSSSQILSFIGLYKERAKTLKDVATSLINLHTPTYTLNENELHALGDTAMLEKYLARLIDTLSQVSEFTAENLSKVIKDLCLDMTIKLPVLAKPIRLALTGTLESPGVFALLALLEKKESIRRLTVFLDFIKVIQPRV
jgi:glutamyl-tRNA synthetase